MILSEPRGERSELYAADLRKFICKAGHENFQNRMFYFVYLLENNFDKSWYIGFTTDLKQRVDDHNQGKGGRTTKKKHSWKLIYFEGYRIKKDAIGREKFLKSGSGRKYLKKQLVNYLANENV